MKNGPLLTVASASVLCLGLSLYQLGERSFWLDEATSYYVSSLSWERMLQVVFSAEHGWHPPSYFILLKSWRTIWGDDQTALRSLSVLFGVLSVPLLYAVGTQVTTRWTAALAALLLGTNAFLIHYAQEARTYTLTLFITLVTYWLLIRAARRKPGRGHWIAYVAVSVVGMFAHTFYALVVAAQAGALMLRGLSAGSGRHAVGAFSAIGLMSLPTLIGALAASGSADWWIPPITWVSLRRLMQEFSGGTESALTAFVAASAMGLAWVLGPGRMWRAGRLLLLWTLLPTLVLAVASLVKPVFVVRYLIVSLPALMLVAAVGLSRLPRWSALPLLAIVLTVSLFAVGEWYSTPHRQWRAIAELLAEEGAPDEGVVLWRHTYRKPLAFQVTQLGIQEDVPALITPPEPWQWNPYTSRERPQSDAAQRLAHCSYDRVWVIGGPDDPRQDEILRLSPALAHYPRFETLQVGDFPVRVFLRSRGSCPSG